MRRDQTKRRWTNIEETFAHRLRGWPNIKPRNSLIKPTFYKDDIESYIIYHTTALGHAPGIK